MIENLNVNKSRYEILQEIIASNNAYLARIQPYILELQEFLRDEVDEVERQLAIEEMNSLRDAMRDRRNITEEAMRALNNDVINLVVQEFINNINEELFGSPIMVGISGVGAEYHS